MTLDHLRQKFDAGFDAFKDDRGETEAEKIARTRIGKEVHIPTWVLIAAAALIAVGFLIDRLRVRAKARAAAAHASDEGDVRR